MVKSDTSHLKLNVVKLGHGRPLILLHGWGHNIERVRGLGEALSNDYEVHLIDLPGFGKSQIPDTPWGTREYSDHIVKYLDHAEIKQAHFLGHSFGGRISIQISANYPDRVNKLVLLNSHGIPVAKTFKRQVRSFGIGVLRNIAKFIDKFLKLDLYKNKFIPTFASADYKAAGSLRPILVKVVNENLTSQASTIKAPTLLLWGEKDTETPRSIGLKLKELIKNSQYLELPGKGHEPFNGVGAHLCAFHILKFLNNEHSKMKDVVNA